MRLVEQLTPRQREVAGMLLEGLSNKAMAQRMGISEGCVKVYVYQMCKAAKVHNRTLLALRIRDDQAG